MTSTASEAHKAAELGSEDRTALRGMEKKIVELVSKGATSRQWAEWLRAPLEHAAAQGDKELAMRLLRAGANGGAGWKGCGDRTLLDAAAEGGHKQVVSALLEAGGLEELDTTRCDDKMTPLHRASKGGHSAAARALVLEGANVRLLDSRNRSALHYAVEGGHFQLAREVVIAGADPQTADVDGNTPLHLAAAHDDYKIVRSLLNRGASVSMSNKQGQHPLHVAIENDHIKVAETLLKAGADPDVRYGFSKIHSPLQLARSSPGMTQILLEHGADTKSEDEYGCTALHWAAWGNASVIDVLVDYGADLEAQTSVVLFGNKFFDGLTPLHEAAVDRNLETVAALLLKGANVNAKDRDGLTPLHVVCTTSGELKSSEVADVLLRWGADETATDNDGNTPEDLIEEGAQPTGRLRQLLVNAPTDRAWRRRGLLVLCRARSSDVSSPKRVHEDTPDGPLSRVVELEANVIFRTIVGYL